MEPNRPDGVAQRGLGLGKGVEVCCERAIAHSRQNPMVGTRAFHDDSFPPVTGNGKESDYVGGISNEGAANGLVPPGHDIVRAGT
jgi:hypothetical protein